MVNVLLHPEDTPLYAVEARTIALTGVGMAALRLALNHWAVDEDASSVVAILFSLFLAPIGVYGLYIFYGEGLPLNVIIAPFHTTLSESDAVARKWGPFFSATLGGGNIFNGYIAYELGWELAVYGFSNLTNLYHHTVFLLLSGLFCLSATYAYLGVAFMIMEISTIPLKIRRLTFRKDFSKAHPLLKKVYGWSTLLFAATFVVTRIAHLALTTFLFLGWVGSGALDGHSPGPTTDKVVALLLVGAFLLQCFWFSLILRKCLPKGKRKKDGKKFN